MSTERTNPVLPPAGRRIPKVVPHPRYGDTVIATDCRATAAEVLACYRHQSSSVIEVFPESALRADPKRQNTDWNSPRYFYADVLQRCAKCRRRYIFFAREQQFWYEELKINVATTSRYCCECAAENRDVEAADLRYQASREATSLSDDALVQRADDLVMLYEAGRVKKLERLNRVKNLLLKRKIPEARWSALHGLLQTGEK